MDLIDGFVLAGGQSRRMGQNKATLLLGGRSLIDRASEALFPIANTVHAVGNITGEVTSLPIIQDHPTKGNTRGAIVGLYTALVNAKTEWVAVLACDLPFVTGELMTRIVETLRQAEDAKVNNVDAAFAEQHDGRIQPLCGLFRRDSCLPEIEKMLSDGDWRLQQLRERLNARIIKFSEIEDIGGAEFLFFNLNTPDDYRSAVELEKQGESDSTK
ncbi:MAG: molybdenum cofactor guanylyltransferase [Acidobacteria bacterium]|nr:molybdenum cofactor guanylyltransferase [Acidobacteriota bacterium]MBP7473844.1 molybdenum cofactor guanylyltransferase [Pyrinomonadaceae bacterium]MBP9109644.1 molybdenum cofactor guanylyltransferase [Pyrinomonadaceae bacterium]